MDIGYGYFHLFALLLAALALGSWLLFRRWRGTSARRSRALNTTVLSLSLLTAFVAAEGYFSLFVDVTDSSMSLLTSARWAKRHYPPPQVFRGRKPWDPDTAGDGGVSIAVVGDSITFGQGIERDADLYPSVLERELRARGIDADVYNISRPGWDTGRELIGFETAAAKGQRFDVVVLGYCLNDIAPYVVESPEFRRARALLQEPPPALAPLLGRSFVASYLYNRYLMLTTPLIPVAESAVIEAFRQPGTFAGHTRELYFFRQLTRSYGARLVVLTFPHFVVPWERYPYRDIHRTLDDFWTGLGVTNLDLLATFERRPVRDLQASRLDTHPNELAHRLAGELLAERLAPLLSPAPDRRPDVAPAGAPP